MSILVTLQDEDSIKQKIGVIGVNLHPYMSTNPEYTTAHHWKTSTLWPERGTILPDP